MQLDMIKTHTCIEARLLSAALVVIEECWVGLANLPMPISTFMNVGRKQTNGNLQFSAHSYDLDVKI